MYPSKVRSKARTLRRKGFTHGEIVKALHVSRGSAHLWTKRIIITKKQKRAILERVRQSAFTPQRRKKLSEWAKIHLAKYRERYTKEDLIRKIGNFYKKHGRIPLKREFNMHREYKRRFGSWNRAIRLAGFSPNPELFTHKFKAKDGHKCDSFAEKIIDDWLYARRIPHERNVPYENTKMTADFSLGSNTFMEFFGLAGVQKKYDALLERKRKVCRERDIRLIEIYPSDLFPKSRLPQLIKYKLLRV